MRWARMAMARCRAPGRRSEEAPMPGGRGRSAAWPAVRRGAREPAAGAHACTDRGPLGAKSVLGDVQAGGRLAVDRAGLGVEE
jgi:hypothetical protein